jgi:hypothetical protein
MVLLVDTNVADEHAPFIIRVEVIRVHAVSHVGRVQGGPKVEPRWRAERPLMLSSHSSRELQSQ